MIGGTRSLQLSLLIAAPIRHAFIGKRVFRPYECECLSSRSLSQSNSYAEQPLDGGAMQIQVRTRGGRIPASRSEKLASQARLIKSERKPTINRRPADGEGPPECKSRESPAWRARVRAFRDMTDQILPTHVRGAPRVAPSPGRWPPPPAGRDKKVPGDSVGRRLSNALIRQMSNTFEAFIAPGALPFGTRPRG